MSRKKDVGATGNTDKCEPAIKYGFLKGKGNRGVH